MEDIAPKLFEKLKEAYEKNLKKLSKKYKPSDYQKAHEYSLIANKAFEKAINEILIENNLPDGKLYFNIAERTVKPLLIKSYYDVGEFSKETQQIINDNNNIGIKAIKPKINQDKVNETISYLANADKFDDVKKDLFTMSENFLQSAVDECVRSNANIQYKRGLNPKIIRRSTGNCCKWCDNLSGVYNYNEVNDTGNNVFRRHRSCRCVVMYSADGGIKNVTDVYTKKKIDYREIVRNRKTYQNADSNKSVVTKLKPIWQSIISLDSENKDDFIELLKEAGVSERYKIAKLDSKLMKLTGSENVILTRGNLAYCLMRHAKHYSSVEVLSKMSEVINKYDYCIPGKTGKKGDLSFIKVYKKDTKECYLLELKMNKIKSDKDEYLVHYLQIKNSNKKKVEKMITKYKSSDIQY